MKKVPFIVIAIFASIIGLHPLTYLFVEGKIGLLATKSDEVFNDELWKLAFYTHIYFGGIALLSGWQQFIKKFRANYLALHRWVGKAYVLSVTLSGLAGFYLAFFATGGLPSGLGFGSLATLWVTTTILGYTTVRNRDIVAHEKWMTRSYALAFAAVTLRLWLPVFLGVFSMDFFVAYPIISWICWIPNLLVAEWYLRKKVSKAAVSVN